MRGPKSHYGCYQLTVHTFNSVRSLVLFDMVCFLIRSRRGFLGGMGWSDLRAGLAISFSAGTYLIAFYFNVAVAVDYYQMDRHGTRQIEFFPSILVMLAVGQLVSMIVFVTRIPREERPIMAACFFPLLQLWRLLGVAWTTFSCAGVAHLQSEAKDRLFNVLGASIENGPQIVLQTLAITSYGSRVSTNMYISIAASILSATYNNSAAVMSVYKFVRSFRLRMAIGAIAAMETVTTLWVHIILTNWSTDNKITKYYGLIVVILQCVTLWVWLGPHDESWKVFTSRRIVSILGYAWVSSTIGHIYILVSDAEDRNELGRRKFWFRFLAIGFANRLLDALFCIYAWHVALSTCPSSPHREPSNSFFMELTIALAPQQDCAHAKRLHHPEVLIGINIVIMLFYVWVDSLGTKRQVDNDALEGDGTVELTQGIFNNDEDAVREDGTLEVTRANINNDEQRVLMISSSLHGRESNHLYLYKYFNRTLSYP